MINQSEYITRTNFTSNEMLALVFDLCSALIEIKSFPEVKSLYINLANCKLEFYIYYDKENFEVEDKIVKKITNFEVTYKFFPEVFIYPLDMIENKELTLPKTAMKM